MIRRPFAFVIAAAALCLLPAAASASFTLGVNAGEIKAKSARLWAHSTKSGKAEVEVATDRRFRHVVVTRNVKAKSSHDDTLQTNVGGLHPGKHYFYRFVMGKQKSKVGQFDTAPKSSSSSKITFGWTGDYDAQPAPGKHAPFWNNFDVFRRMQREGNDFNIALGDTIYSDSEVPGTGSQDGITLKEKWGKYARNLKQRKLASLRGSTGFYSHWDDHEFYNDFSTKENSFDTGSGSDKRTLNINGGKLYDRGVKAFRDYAPITYSKRNGIYRTFRWGKNVELFFLDERSFRSANADAGGTCDNPQTGEPDIAPTAPQSTRNTFALVFPPLAQPVPQACKDKINDPNRTYLGARQLARFEKAVKRSNARFKVVMNELPIQQYYTLPYDRWEGFEAERQSVLRFLRDNVKNVIFLTTDVHAALVNDARFKTLESGGPENSGILDVTVGSAATQNYEGEIDRATGHSGNGRLVDDFFFEPQPPNGVGMICSVVNKFSYGEVTVTKKHLFVELKGIDGKALTDEDGKVCPAFSVP